MSQVILQYGVLNCMYFSPLLRLPAISHLRVTYSQPSVLAECSRKLTAVEDEAGLGGGFGFSRLVGV